MRLADHPEWALDVAMGKYAAGTEIVSWIWHKGDNQRFVINDDKTISP